LALRHFLEALVVLTGVNYRSHYRDELSTSALAWLLFNIAVATTLRYIESDDPIRLDELRAGLKFALPDCWQAAASVPNHPAMMRASRSSPS
jgi:hypothetical protein